MGAAGCPGSPAPDGVPPPGRAAARRARPRLDRHTPWRARPPAAHRQEMCCGCLAGWGGGRTVSAQTEREWRSSRAVPCISSQQPQNANSGLSSPSRPMWFPTKLSCFAAWQKRAAAWQDKSAPPYPHLACCSLPTGPTPPSGSNGQRGGGPSALTGSLQDKGKRQERVRVQTLREGERLRRTSKG